VKKVGAGLWSLFFWLFLASVSKAAWHVEAEKFIYYFQAKIIVAEGEVVLRGEGLTITCARARYERVTKKLTLWGPLRIVSEDGDYLEGLRGWLNLETLEGEIEQGHLYLEKHKFHVLAKRMKRFPDNEYRAEDATITTCKICSEGGCAPAWSFHCRTLRITRGGKGKGYHTTFNIRGVPLLYSPYVSISLKKERKNGFLFPRLVHSSREGTGVEVPLYLAVNDSFDFTFYPYYTETRGFMTGLEARYVLSSQSKGIVRYRYLHDRLEDNDYNHDGFLRTNQDRFWLTAKVDQALAPSWMLRLDLDLLSDKDFLYEFDGGNLGFTKSHESYLRKFGRGLEEKNTSYRTNRLWLTFARDGYFFQTSATYYDGQISGEQEGLLMPLPRVYFSFLRTPLVGPLSFSGSVSHTYWWREEGFRGRRLELVPQVSLAPRLFSFWDLDVTYRFRQAYYWVDWEDTRGVEEMKRSLYEIEARSGVTLYRIYAFRFCQITALRHSLRPEISYFYRPEEDQNELPLFTDEDRLPPVQAIRYGVRQFLTAKEEGPEGPRYFDLARLWIYQTYDFREDEPLSNLYLDAELRLPEYFYLRLD